MCAPLHLFPICGVGGEANAAVLAGATAVSGGWLIFDQCVLHGQYWRLADWGETQGYLISARLIAGC